MIDDPKQAQALMAKMKAELPIPAKMTSRLARYLRDEGKRFRSREVMIKRTFYSGDEGGILCDITPSPDAKEAWVVSLTHLRVSPRHPVGEEIRAYQQARNIALAQQGR